MSDVVMRTFAEGEDPYHVLAPLEQFLKEKNSEALMKVLRDDIEIGTHGAVTRGIILSSCIKARPDVQQELFDALMNFDIASLNTFDAIREMLSFSYFSLSEDKKLKETPKYMPPLRDKRLEDFRAGKFTSLPRNIQGQILMETVHGTTRLSEAEVDALTELKECEHGSYRAGLMYERNTHKALDFIAQAGKGQKLLGFVIMRRISEPEVQIDSIDYIFSKYDHILSDENRDSLKKWRTWAQEKKSKLTDQSS